MPLLQYSARIALKCASKPSLVSMLITSSGSSPSSIESNVPSVAQSRTFSIASALYSADLKRETDGKTPATATEGRLRRPPERSYLEEVLLNSADNNGEPKTTAQKVKKGATNTFFYAVFAVSIVAVSTLAYFLFDSLWAFDSPQRVYSNALKLIRNDERCLDLFGSTIAAHGENSGRGRRRHIANKRYVTRDGEERVRVVFHIKGDQRKGRATVEIAKRDGVWDYRFLMVESDGLVPDTIVLLDNRRERSRSGH